MKRSPKALMASGAAALTLTLLAGARAQDNVAAPVAAPPADPFSALVGRSLDAEQRRPRIERYAVAADGRAFVVEGRVGKVRIMFLCGDGDARLECNLDPSGGAPEIMLATGARGPRGDVIIKSLAGDVLLRLTAYGGATVYWPGRGQGEAASRAFGDFEPLTLPPADPNDARRRAARATMRLSQLTGGSIVFDPGVSPSRDAAAPAAALAPADGEAPDARVLADAVVRVAAGMADVARDPTGARVLSSRIGLVRFTEGSPPRLQLEGKVLNVIYDPKHDAEGRPSSGAVARFLEESL